jgi:hypothetical protein
MEPVAGERQGPDVLDVQSLKPGDTSQFQLRIGDQDMDVHQQVNLGSHQ